MVRVSSRIVLTVVIRSTLRLFELYGSYNNHVRCIPNGCSYQVFLSVNTMDFQRDFLQGFLKRNFERIFKMDFKGKLSNVVKICKLVPFEFDCSFSFHKLMVFHTLDFLRLAFQYDVIGVDVAARRTDYAADCYADYYYDDDER